MSPDEVARLCWGKSRQGVHPALYHLLDAGAVAQALVTADAGRALRGLLAWDAALVGAVVALHDLGKLCPGFQGKNPAACSPAAADLPQPTAPVTDHPRVTAAHLAGGQRCPHRILLARALGAHHGAFPAHDRHWCKDHTRLGGPQWAEVRDAAMAAIADAFEQPADFLDRLVLDTPGAVVLAGLTAIADWLASDCRSFPANEGEPRDWAAYQAVSRQRAQEAVARVGWQGPPAGPPPIEFSGLFGFDPNGLQAAAVTAAAGCDGPRLVLVEAPMGRGKTEAALYLTDRLQAVAAHVGLYVALPTMATSSQMFDRVCRQYLDRRYALGGAQAALLHGQAAFDQAFEALVNRDTATPEPVDVHDEQGGDEPCLGAVAAASWFRGGKQGLLTPFAVGTIDQALLGALQSGHQFVRLYGLANKVVILDEVHAYDAYTGTLLERLLAWLRALRCSVVLLSATLTAARREALLKAWGAEPPATWGDYPRLTIANGQAAVQSVACEPVRPYRLQRLDTTSTGWVQAVTAKLASELAEGGCAAWICNTVDRAQRAYLALGADPRFADCEVLLFHARFPLARRLAIEAAVKDRFGKDGGRPAKAVLVATQVIEQSLDLDFDLMVSDPAPLDLLLQRAGRLQRHDRGCRRRPATLYWLGCDEDQWEALCHDFAKVYDPWPLRRTRELLGTCHEVATAAELARLVETAYENADERWLNQRQGETNTARDNAIAHPDDDDPFGRSQAIPGDDAQDPTLPVAVLRALTRLGPPSVTLVVATLVGDTLDLGDGGALLSRRDTPGREDVRRLLRCTVRLSHHAWFEALRDRAEPAWKSVPELRHARLLPLQNHRCTLAQPPIRRCEELGLVYE